MSERPGVHVTLCSFTHSADRRLLLPETLEVTDPAELTLNEEQKLRLFALGNARSEQLKTRLIQQKIEAERVVLCEPEHVEGEELARVEVSI